MKKSELKTLIIESIKEILKEERSSDKIFFIRDTNTLWIAHSPGSGTAQPLKKLQNGSYKSISDVETDDSYNDSTSRVINWADKNNPIKIKDSGKVRIYEIPVYKTAVNKGGYTEENTLDIWGGEIKPEKNMYLRIAKTGKNDSNNIVVFFDNKREAYSF